MLSVKPDPEDLIAAVLHSHGITCDHQQMCKHWYWPKDQPLTEIEPSDWCLYSWLDSDHIMNDRYLRFDFTVDQDDEFRQAQTQRRMDSLLDEIRSLEVVAGVRVIGRLWQIFWAEGWWEREGEWVEKARKWMSTDPSVRIMPSPYSVIYRELLVAQEGGSLKPSLFSDQTGQFEFREVPDDRLLEFFDPLNERSDDDLVFVIDPNPAVDTGAIEARLKRLKRILESYAIVKQVNSHRDTASPSRRLWHVVIDTDLCQHAYDNFDEDAMWERDEEKIALLDEQISAEGAS
jgi:hypothetical protein